MAVIHLIPADYRQAFNKIKKELHSIVDIEAGGALVIGHQPLDCDEYDRLKSVAVQCAKLRLQATVREV